MMKHWSDDKLDKELAFAEAAAVEEHPETVEWLKKLKAEKARRETA